MVAEGPKSGEASGARSRRVLIVEDNVDAAETLQLLLRMSGYDTRAAYEGVAALNIVREFRPDVVLMDIGLPGQDGYAVARAMRALPHMKSALLVALTGYGEDEDRRHAAEAGFNTLRVKPMEPDQLEKLLQEHFRSAGR